MGESSIFITLGIGYVGLIVHFLKKKIKGEGVKEITSFFTNNPKQTLLSVITVAVGILVLHNKMPVSYEMAFGMGYMVDSVLNKWDKPR